MQETCAVRPRLLGLLPVVPSCSVVQHLQIDRVFRQVDVAHDTAADEAVVHGRLHRQTAEATAAAQRGAAATILDERMDAA